jgi:hypothetical protein
MKPLGNAKRVVRGEQLGHDKKTGLPVLVDVGPVSEPSKRIHSRETLWVRLIRLDDCSGPWANSSQPPLLPLCEFLATPDKRELKQLGLLVGGSGPVSHSQLKDRMVKGGPEVLDAITDNQREPGGWLLLDLQPVDVLRSIRFNVAGHSEWFGLEEPFYSVVKGFQVFIGTPNLGVGRVE